MKLDAILASVPLDKTAASVTSKGEHWTPARSVEEWHVHSETPLPMKPIPMLDGTKGLAGAKFGRLTVMGHYTGPKSKNTRARYVVRCACGDYEIRSAKAIRQADPDAACAKCEYQRKLREGRRSAPAYKIGLDGKVIRDGGAA